MKRYKTKFIEVDISKKFTPEELQAIKIAFMQVANELDTIDFDDMMPGDVAEIVWDNIESYYKTPGMRLGKQRVGRQFDKELNDKLSKILSTRDLIKFGVMIWTGKI